MTDPNLVTTCNFHGQEFLFKMNIFCNNLEILVTDKSSGEEWQCSYDATYIENLTHKTGNFKQFEIFLAMIKSGLLRTSESVTLDLLTFEDLELLRSRKITKTVGPSNNNRRYLIVTYIVEFDKIRYPLPLEYCGPPDPLILQATIRRLEVELARAKEELAVKSNNNEAKKIFFFQKRIDELTEENLELHEEVRRLSKQIGKKPRNQVLSLQKAVSTLEKCVVNERNSHHELVEKLKNDKNQLAKELAKVKCSEKNLKAKLNKISEPSRLGEHLKIPTMNKLSHASLKTMYRRGYSPVGGYERPVETIRHTEYYKPTKPWEQSKKTKSSIKCVRSRDSSSSSTKYAEVECFETENVIPLNRNHSPSPQRTKSLLKSRYSSPESRTSSRGSSRSSKIHKKHLDYKKLEEKIENLHKLLKNNGICDKEV